jgi:hypothetical protein
MSVQSTDSKYCWVSVRRELVSSQLLSGVGGEQLVLKGGTDLGESAAGHEIAEKASGRSADQVTPAALIPPGGSAP